MLALASTRAKLGVSRLARTLYVMNPCPSVPLIGFGGRKPIPGSVGARPAGEKCEQIASWMKRTKPSGSFWLKIYSAIWSGIFPDGTPDVILQV